MKIELRSSGSFNKTENFLNKILSKKNHDDILNKWGKIGVENLKAATPIDTGFTADHWGYEIVHKGSTTYLYFTNENLIGETPVAILLQYGHMTGTGGWVEGRDFINPALRNVFDEIANSIWKEVTGS